MAQRAIIELIDDVDGSTASETIRFALDGERYEIDLSELNAARLRAALRPFTGAGRRIQSRGQQVRPGDPSHRDVRRWAQSKGYDAPKRGRVSNALMEQYLADAA